MERKYECKKTDSRNGFMRLASEGLMANLPILVCGAGVGLMLAREMLIR